MPACPSWLRARHQCSCDESSTSSSSPGARLRSVGSSAWKANMATTLNWHGVVKSCDTAGLASKMEAGSAKEREREREKRVEMDEHARTHAHTHTHANTHMQTHAQTQQTHADTQSAKRRARETNADQPVLVLLWSCWCLRCPVPLWWSDLLHWSQGLQRTWWWAG